MSWPNYDGSKKPNKGQEGGACNIGLCQNEQPFGTIMGRSHDIAKAV